MLARFRSLVTPLALIAAVILVYMENPWFYPKAGTTENQVGRDRLLGAHDRRHRAHVRGPQVAGCRGRGGRGACVRALPLSNTRAGLFWLPIRIFLGFEFAVAGWHKIDGKGWIDGGAALLGYWQNAVKVPAAGQGSPPVTFDWYRSFLQLLIDNHAQAGSAGSSRSASSPWESGCCLASSSGSRPSSGS